LTPRPTHVEIDNGGNMHALREARLREKHRAELACTDYGNRHRPAGRLTLKKFCVEIQDILRRRCATET
jgi:hypothetical protein